MKKRPTTLKEVFKELIERCEQCGSNRINVVEYKIFKPEARSRGFLASLGDVLVPADPDEYEAYIKEKERKNKNGVEIEYYCMNCNSSFIQFYDDKTMNAFVDFFNEKYND